MTNGTGRTLWDLIAEYPVVFLSLGALAVILLLLGLIDFKELGITRGTVKLNPKLLLILVFIIILAAFNWTDIKGFWKEIDSGSSDTYIEDDSIKPPIINGEEPEGSINNESREEIIENPKSYISVFFKAKDYDVIQFDLVKKNGKIIAKNREYFQQQVPLGSKLIFFFEKKIILDTIIN